MTIVAGSWVIFKSDFTGIVEVISECDERGGTVNIFIEHQHLAALIVLLSGHKSHRVGFLF
jgi:hypothetical protein